MEWVSHDGRVTVYRQTQSAASGPAALYVHGSGATHRVWGRQYAPSGPTHPAVALDLSGHGESDDIDTAAGTPTLDAYADDVVAVGRETDADVLIGNSLGGAIAQWVALERDWTPEALVLLGTGPELPVFEGLQEWLANDWDRAVEFLHERDRLFHDTDHEAVSRSREGMEEVGQAVTRRDFMTCHRFDVSDRLGEIDVPVLAVCGEHDKLTPRAYHETMAREVADGEASFVPDAAHLAMVEQAEIFNDILEEFIEDAV